MNSWVYVILWSVWHFMTDLAFKMFCFLAECSAYEVDRGNIKNYKWTAYVLKVITMILKYVIDYFFIITFAHKFFVGRFDDYCVWVYLIF